MSQLVDRLTERQRACLALVGQAYTSKEIGRQLGISPSTVDNHIRAALDILQVESRTEAARLMLSAAPNQTLPSQSAPLAAQPVLSPSSLPAAAFSASTRSWFGRAVPPLGGQFHDLSFEQKLFAILRVAVLGLAGLVTLTLVAAGLLWLAR